MGGGWYLLWAARVQVGELRGISPTALLLLKVTAESRIQDVNGHYAYRPTSVSFPRDQSHG